MPLFDLFRKLTKKEQTQASPTRPVTSSNINHSSQDHQPVELLKSIANNSTDGLGNRLVLGEGMLPMQEALKNGGRYILVHPEVSSQLQQNNIDPFLVYETAMRMEIAALIPQIDFVGVRVDELLRTWKGKPEHQAPIHARQALWLQRNANQFGYEKNGNGWKLKQ